MEKRVSFQSLCDFGAPSFLYICLREMREAVKEISNRKTGNRETEDKAAEDKETEEIRLTVERHCVQVEDQDKAVRFFGDLSLEGFFAEAGSVEWIRYRGSTPEQDRDELIRKVLRHQRDKRFKIVFLDENYAPLYKDELGWSVDSHLPAFYWAVTLGLLLFLGLMAFSLRNVEGVNPALNLVCAAYAIPLAALTLWGSRFRLTVEGRLITVRRAAGKKYSFSTDEITKVIRRVQIDMGGIWTDRVTIYAKSRRVSVSSYLTDMEKLDRFLLWYVSGRKIVTKEKKSHAF